MIETFHRFIPIGKARKAMPEEYTPSNLVGMDCAAFTKGAMIVFHDLSSKTFKIIDQIVEVAEDKVVINHVVDMPAIKPRGPSLKLVADNPSRPGGSSSAPAPSEAATASLLDG